MELPLSDGRLRRRTVNQAVAAAAYPEVEVTHEVVEVTKGRRDRPQLHQYVASPVARPRREVRPLEERALARPQAVGEVALVKAPVGVLHHPVAPRRHAVLDAAPIPSTVGVRDRERRVGRHRVVTKDAVVNIALARRQDAGAVPQASDELAPVDRPAARAHALAVRLSISPLARVRRPVRVGARARPLSLSPTPLADVRGPGARGVAVRAPLELASAVELATFKFALVAARPVGLPPAAPPVERAVAEGPLVAEGGGRQNAFAVRRVLGPLAFIGVVRRDAPPPAPSAPELVAVALIRLREHGRLGGGLLLRGVGAAPPPLEVGRRPGEVAPRCCGAPEPREERRLRWRRGVGQRGVERVLKTSTRPGVAALIRNRVERRGGVRLQDGGDGAARGRRGRGPRERRAPLDRAGVDVDDHVGVSREPLGDHGVRPARIWH